MTDANATLPVKYFKCKQTKHSNQEVEIIRLDYNTRHNYMSSTGRLKDERLKLY